MLEYKITLASPDGKTSSTVVAVTKKNGSYMQRQETSVPTRGSGGFGSQ